MFIRSLWLESSQNAVADGATCCTDEDGQVEVAIAGSLELVRHSSNVFGVELQFLPHSFCGSHA